jgi:hypothetical protein
MALISRERPAKSNVCRIGIHDAVPCDGADWPPFCRHRCELHQRPQTPRRLVAQPAATPDPFRPAGAGLPGEVFIWASGVETRERHFQGQRYTNPTEGAQPFTRHPYSPLLSLSQNCSCKIAYLDYLPWCNVEPRTHRIDSTTQVLHSGASIPFSFRRIPCQS